KETHRSVEVAVRIPLLAEEGWTRPQQDIAKPSLRERTGWSHWRRFLAEPPRSGRDQPQRINNLFHAIQRVHLFGAEGNSKLFLNGNSDIDLSDRIPAVEILRVRIRGDGGDVVLRNIRNNLPNSNQHFPFSFHVRRFL